MSTSKARSRDSSSKSAATTKGAAGNLRGYQLDERVGQDELATIYRGTHITLGRPVYIHILRHTDWVSVSRFQLAARLAAKLSHPNLMPVIDAGHDDTYGHYLVTPLLDASTLADALEAEPLPVVSALRIATQIGAVLDYLHQQAVIHRDVQPANILATPQGAAYLTNLSLAASADTPDLAELAEADYLTPYSAPEQRLDSDAAAALDTYSLGAVVYHMLSGEIPPQPGEDIPSLAKHDPALASADRIVQRMMDPQPAARYPSAGAAASALRQALRDKIDLATEDMEESRWEPSADWLENPLEAVLGSHLDTRFDEFLTRSRKRADDIHRRDVIRRLLNRWSRDGFFRRSALGQIAQPEQIISYNVYFYELRTHYEKRTPPEPRQRAQRANERSAFQGEIDVWSVIVPESKPFDAVRNQELAIPGSLRVFTCTECGGVATIPCKTCQGKGTIDREQRVRDQENTTKTETLTKTCPTCRGYGKQECPKCEGTGNLAEEQVFTWSQRAREWANTDDIDDLPKLALQQRAEPVFEGPINVYAGRWHSVAPLTELLRAAITEAGEHTRLVAAELSIKGAPITEVDFRLNEDEHHLHIVGFDNEIIGDWSLLNPERLVLLALAGVLVLAIIIAVLVIFLT